MNNIIDKTVEPVTPTELAEWRAVAEKATLGPYFVAHDTARDCGPHADSLG